MTELSLGEKQKTFMFLLPRLLDFIHSRGYELTGGQLLRTQLEANHNAANGTGIVHSLHLKSLAIDLNFFKDGVYLTDSKDLEFAGVFWESLCKGQNYKTVWGGRFSKPDGNHFSIEHGGVK